MKFLQNFQTAGEKQYTRKAGLSTSGFMAGAGAAATLC
jgi:hypothetical protein